jgi:hypothetical protein
MNDIKVRLVISIVVCCLFVIVFFFGRKEQIIGDNQADFAE